MSSKFKKIVIKKATRDDWKLIKEIQENDGFNHAYFLDKERIKRLIKRGEFFFLVYLNDKAVGFFSVEFEIRARIHFFSVGKEYQNQGIGSQMMEFVIKETVDRKYSEIHVFTEISLGLDRLLKKFNFKKVGFYRDRFGVGRNAIIWSLRLLGSDKFFITNKKGAKLSAVLDYPDKRRQYPAIILLHGFLGYKEEEHSASLAKDLAKNGFVAIRFDASGFGESDGSIKNDFRESNYFNDIKCVYNYLSKLEFVDKRRIGVWGHSMGAQLAIIFAVRNKKIEAVCSVSPLAVFAEEDCWKNKTKEWRNNGLIEVNTSRFGKISLPFDFYLDAQKWNALVAVGLLKTPLFMIVGDSDTVVPSSVSKKIYKAVESSKNLLEIKGMGHDYKRHEKYLKRVNREVVNFFRKQLL